MFDISQTPIYENARTQIHGDSIKRMIKASGIPMYQICAALGISQKTLWNRLDEETRFTGDEIGELVYLLDGEIEGLFVPARHPLSVGRKLIG